MIHDQNEDTWLTSSSPLILLIFWLVLYNYGLIFVVLASFSVCVANIEVKEKDKK